MIVKVAWSGYLNLLFDISFVLFFVTFVMLVDLFGMKWLERNWGRNVLHIDDTRVHVPFGLLTIK